MVRKRIFLALPIEPVEPTIEKMEQLQKLLCDYRIKWVRKENIHLTLFFLKVNCFLPGPSTIRLKFIHYVNKETVRFQY